MLLRSSSTPILSSLLPSFAESPNNNSGNSYHESNTTVKHHLPPSSNLPPNPNKLSFHQAAGSLLLSCNSSPMSPSVAELSYSGKGIRRAQSEGNLEGLIDACCHEELNITNQPKKPSGRTKCLMLETIPSFSSYDPKTRCHEEGGEEEEEEDSGVADDQAGEESLGENIGGTKRLDEQRIMSMNDVAFNSENKKENTVMTEEVRVIGKTKHVEFEQEAGLGSQGLFLAKGLGIDCSIGGGGGGGGEFNRSGCGGNGGDDQGIEEYYKRMVEENPGNPLFLRNYAQFLYQSKHDLEGAEQYYSRAILIDPNDGDILSQYAKVIWVMYHDQERASIYFERAVQASPEDSHVHAAYASFLWETEEEEEECNAPIAVDYMLPQFHEATVGSSNA